MYELNSLPATLVWWKHIIWSLEVVFGMELYEASILEYRLE